MKYISTTLSKNQVSFVLLKTIGYNELMSVIVSFIEKLIPAVFAPSAGGDMIDLSDFLTHSDNTPIKETFGTPADMINLLVSNLFIIAGLLLFVYVIAAGYALITSGGADQTNKASGQITKGLIGFIVMFAAYWITKVLVSITGIPIDI